MSEASSGLSWTMLARGSCFSDVFWPCWRQEGEQQGQDGDMMTSRWVMIVPKWGMIMARRAFRAQLGSFWGSSGSIFDNFRRWAGKRKTYKNLWFSSVFALSGGSEGV